MYCKHCNMDIGPEFEYVGSGLKCKRCKGLILTTDKPFDESTVKKLIQPTVSKSTELNNTAMLSTNVTCPKCNSSSITAVNVKTGFSIEKALLGSLLLGPDGVIGGILGNEKIQNVCLACSHKWSPSETKKNSYTEEISTKQKSQSWMKDFIEGFKSASK